MQEIEGGGNKDDILRAFYAYTVASLIFLVRRSIHIGIDPCWITQKMLVSMPGVSLHMSSYVKIYKIFRGMTMQRDDYVGALICCRFWCWNVVMLRDQIKMHISFLGLVEGQQEERLLSDLKLRIGRFILLLRWVQSLTKNKKRVLKRIRWRHFPMNARWVRCLVAQLPHILEILKM